MKYTVLWSAKAEDRLAELWVESSNRNALTESAKVIDELLRADPDRVGESRPDGTRVLFVPPVGVLYSIQHSDQVVSVLALWRFKKHGTSPSRIYRSFVDRTTHH